MKTFPANHTFTAAEIDGLAAGDVLANCFGRLEPITSITGVGTCLANGKRFACFYQRNGDDDRRMSGHINEGRAVVTA